MKRCPSCERTYTEDALSFCPNDGTPLVTDTPPASFDPQATIMASPPKVSAPSGPFDQPSGPTDWPSQPPPAQNNWSAPQPPAQQQGGWDATPGSYQPGSQVMGGTGWQAPPPPPFPGAGAGQEKGLAIAALVCGVISLLCFTLAGPVAIILGVMALNKEKSDPVRYGGGKGMAIGGIVTGSLATLMFIAVILFFIITSAVGTR